MNKDYLWEKAGQTLQNVLTDAAITEIALNDDGKLWVQHRDVGNYTVGELSLRAMERRSRGRVVCGRLRFANQPAGMCSKSLCSRKAICGSCVCSTHTVVLRRTS